MSTFQPIEPSFADPFGFSSSHFETITDSRQIKEDDLEELLPFADFESHESYPFSLQKNRRGEKIPVYPYVISILGDLKLKPGDPKEVNVRKTLRKYLEQVIKLWESRAGEEAPLIIMLSFLGSVGRIITQEALEIQRNHPCVHLMAVLPMERGLLSKDEQKDVEEFNPQFNPTQDERIADPLCERRYVWELTDKDLSCEENSKITNLHSKRFNKKFRASKQRRFHEMLAIHSHLMVVLWSNGNFDENPQPQNEELITEALDCAPEESFVPDEGTIEWIVRMKLEGYYGELLHEHTDTLTYTAIGPVLYVDTSEKSLEEKKGLTVYYLPDGTEITKEKEGRRVMTAENLKKIAPRRWKWLREHNIAKEDDILKNITLIGELNRKIIEETKPNRKPLHEFVMERYLRNLRQTETLTRNPYSHKVNIHQPEISTQQFMNHYQVVDKMADRYREKTEKDTKFYLWTLRFILYGTLLFAFFAHTSYLAYGISVWKPLNLGTELWNEGTCSSKIWLAALVLSAAFLCYGFVRIFRCFIRFRKHNHLYYHCFLTLAESIQVQIFWRMGGVDSMVSGHFRSHQIDSLKWLRIALNGLDVTIPSALPPVNFHKQVRFVDKIWVESTETYIKGQIKDFEQDDHNFFKWLSTKFEKNLKYSSDWWYYLFKMILVAGILVTICIRPVFMNYSVDSTCNTVSMGPTSISQIIENSFLHVMTTIELVCKFKICKAFWSCFSWGSVVWSALLCVIQILLAMWLILFIKHKMSLDEKNYDKHKAMLPTFVMADYLLDFISDENSSMRGNTTSSELTKEHQKQCRDILEELGQEVLAKTADWFLASADREMTKPK